MTIRCGYCGQEIERNDDDRLMPMLAGLLNDLSQDLTDWAATLEVVANDPDGEIIKARERIDRGEGCTWEEVTAIFERDDLAQAIAGGKGQDLDAESGESEKDNRERMTTMHYNDATDKAMQELGELFRQHLGVSIGQEMECEHEWLDVTRANDTGKRELCRLCGAERITTSSNERLAQAMAEGKGQEWGAEDLEAWEDLDRRLRDYQPLRDAMEQATKKLGREMCQIVTNLSALLEDRGQ